MASNKIAKITPTWHYNILGHFFVLIFIFIVICFIIIIRQDLFSKQVNQIKENFFSYSKNFGLTLDDIVIEGRDKISKQEVLTLLDLNRDNSFLAIDEKDIKQKIKKLKWVKNVNVKKNYIPNVLQISIQEKNVIALYQKNNTFFALDENGEIINAPFTPKKEYIIVSGNNAPKHVLDIVKVTSSNPGIFKRIKALQYVSDRRWNIILDDIENGKTIKLPQQNYQAAWKKLLKLNTTRGLLKRPLTIIDLRFDNKVILKLNKQTIKKEVKETKA